MSITTSALLLIRPRWKDLFGQVATVGLLTPDTRNTYPPRICQSWTPGGTHSPHQVCQGDYKPSTGREVAEKGGRNMLVDTYQPEKWFLFLQRTSKHKCMWGEGEPRKGGFNEIPSKWKFKGGKAPLSPTNDNKNISFGIVTVKQRQPGLEPR